MMDAAKKREMVERAGGRSTVPQIFIDGRHIGGCDELHALDRAGKLEPHNPELFATEGTLALARHDFAGAPVRTPSE